MKKILIVDDENITKSLSEQLENFYEFNVTLLQDYSQIDNELLKGYDAIVLDLMMPVIVSYFSEDEIIKAEKGMRTGIVLFDKIRTKLPRIPIVFHSAVRTRIECDEYTIVVRKPELVHLFAKTLNELIERLSTS